MGGQLGTESKILGVLGFVGSRAADPWLWLAGLSACTKREGVPLPRSGGGWEGADASAIPYKHRLAHAPGRHSRSGRAFRCVGVLGQRPKRVLVPFTRVKGTPRRRAVQTKFSKNLAPPKVITGYVATAPQQPPVNHPTSQISANRSPTAAGRFDCVETHGLRPCRRLRRRACGRPTILIFPTKSHPFISTI